MCVGVYAHECRHLWGPILSDTLDLKLQMISSCTMWVLGSEFWSSAKAARVLKFWAIPLVLIRSLLAERPTLTVSGTISGLWFIDWFKRRKAVDCWALWLAASWLWSQCDHQPQAPTAFPSVMDFSSRYKPAMRQVTDRHFEFLCSHGLRFLQADVTKTGQSIDNIPKSRLL